MLTELGFGGDDDDEDVYRAIMSSPGATAGEVAELLGRTIEQVLTALRHLAAQSLVTPTDDEGDGTKGRRRSEADPATRRWIASPPELVLGPLVARSRERLRRAENRMADLVETYHRGRVPQSAIELIELVDGGQAQAHRLAQLEYGARTAVSAFQSGRNTVVSIEETIDLAGHAPDDWTDGPAPARPDLHYRIVIDPTYLTEPGAVRKLDEWVAAGQELRVALEPLIKLAIADDDVAMVQVSPRTSVMIRRPLVTLAIELFEATWRSARPYLRDDSDLDPVDQRILQLMLAGLTDTSMAGQIGTSSRTVQRRIKALLDLAGVSTRVQLGWFAVRHGWV